jgi:predicted nucleic acid-binding protein
MIVLDTNVIIDLWRGRDGVKNCLEDYKDELLCISAITISEIYDGLGYTKEKRGTDIYKEIESQFEKIFTEFEIIPINLNILKKSGMVKGELRAKGTILDFGDCIVGITAKIIKAEKILSRNPKHFSEFDVPLESYEIK